MTEETLEGKGGSREVSKGSVGITQARGEGILDQGGSNGGGGKWLGSGSTWR